jgi:ABC-type branched-subunit amino acid transport system permease subunit
MSSLWPFIVIGVFTGSIYGLAAMGVVLTYKTVGVFNFAYGALAMFCAFTYWEVHDNWGLSAWIAMPALFLVVAPALGVGLEWLFRPLAGLATEVQIVVSLGILAALSALVPLVYGAQDRQLEAILPTSTFVLGSHLHVGYDQLGNLIISAAMAALLWALLRHTRFGMATRAVVDNPDLSDMIGVHGDNVRRAAWILSTIFAALVGILISPSQGLDVNELVLVVIYSFAPAVLGRLVSLPWAYAGGLLLGIVGSVLSKYANSGTVSNVEAALPYLALFVLLVVMGSRLKEVSSTSRRLSTATHSSSSTTSRQLSGWAARFVNGGDPGGPGTTGRRFVLPSACHRLTVDRNAVLGGGGLILALLVPLAVPGPRLIEVTAAFIYALIALTLVVLTGWAGQISLCQFSFVGVGAFTAGHLAGSHGQHFLFAVLVGMLLAAPLGIVVGLVSLRLSGLYLALATLAFALIMDDIVFNRPDVSGGLTGITVPRPRIFGLSFSGRASLYELAVIVFGLAAITAYALRNGPIGRRLHILRDSPLAASTLGVNLTVTKLVVFVICGMVAAVGGALYGALQQAITPLDFMWSTSLTVLLLVVLGGRSVISGAVIAGGVYAVQLLPIPPRVAQIIPLAIAIGVIGLAQEIEGTIALARRQVRFVMAVLRPLPRRNLTPFSERSDFSDLALSSPDSVISTGAGQNGHGHGHGNGRVTANSTVDGAAAGFMAETNHG